MIRRPVVVVSLLALNACGGGSKASSGEQVLTGTLVLTKGTCTSGSQFRMVQPSGTVAAGPFVSNVDSPCSDKTVTPLTGGGDGGLKLGAYQPEPSPAFDAKGASKSIAVTQVQPFFGVGFSISTAATDPQSGKAVPVPRLTVKGGVVSGDLSAFSAAWNGQHFNQGAPKPGGGAAGQTILPHGTYDAATKHLMVEWTSQIKGGPFNTFTGVWHLEGVLRA